MIWRRSTVCRPVQTQHRVLPQLKKVKKGLVGVCRGADLFGVSARHLRRLSLDGTWEKDEGVARWFRAPGSAREIEVGGEDSVGTSVMLTGVKDDPGAISGPTDASAERPAVQRRQLIYCGLS